MRAFGCPGQPLPQKLLPKQVGGAADALKLRARSGAGRVYVYGKVRGGVGSGWGGVEVDVACRGLG